MIKGVRKRKEIMSTEIDELTFSELCERIKIDYEDKLPESAYNSPEALIEAMTALQKDKPNFSMRPDTIFMEMS